VPSLPPPPRVLAAFGVPGARPVPLGGGQGTAWLAGEMVLKPADMGRDELEWQARIHSRVRCDGFRLSRVRPALDGSLCVEGWYGTQYLAGWHEQRRWPEILAAGERLHAALRGIARPPFMGQRSSPWAIGDRTAWGENSASQFAHVRHLPQLTAVLCPVTAPSQLIHGDLTGNVLFHDQLPPAIIDFSPYWRPPAFASAIVVADALVWEGADSHLLDAVGHISDFGQYLARALIYRAVTDWLLTPDEPAEPGVSLDRLAPAVDLACQLATLRHP
jgi:uncharacterized protein (TIGR02569 family)